MSNILLDMDGVFVNFVRGSQKAHKMPFEPVSSWNYFEDWGISASKFWKEIDREEYFWEALEPLPWYKEIIELVSRYDRKFVILTSPHNSCSCYAGKRKWLSNYLGIDVPRRAVFTNRKELLAKRNSILIDDHTDNCVKFDHHGGKSIMFPANYNDNSVYLDNPVEFVREELERMMA